MRELHSEAGDRLELVQGASGVAEPAARHLPENAAARGHQWRQHQSDLVAHAAAGMLVQYRVADEAQVQRLARAHHCARQRYRLLFRETPQHDRHEEGARLIGRYGTPHDAAHKGVHALGVQLLAVALPGDDVVNDVH